MYDDSNARYWESVSVDEIMTSDVQSIADLSQHLSPPAHILEVGCGKGQLSEQLGRGGYRVVATDVNLQAIDLGVSRQSQVQYRRANVLNLPYADKYFDGVVCSFVFASLIEPTKRARAAAELTRVTRDGGVVWVADALVSPEYAARYAFAKSQGAPDNCVFVFHDPALRASCTATQQVVRALARNEYRLAMHATEKDLLALFPQCTAINPRVLPEVSAHSGMQIQKYSVLLQRQNL